MLQEYLVVIIIILEQNGAKVSLNFNGDSLKQNKVTYNHRAVVNIYIVYKISSTSTSFIRFTLKNCLFGAAKVKKNSNISTYKYSGYRIGFNSKGSFLHADGSYSVNVIIFGAALRSSRHANNNNKN